MMWLKISNTSKAYIKLNSEITSISEIEAVNRNYGKTERAYKNR